MWKASQTNLLGFVFLLWTEMHRHPDREGVPGKSGWREGHLQLPGLNASNLPAGSPPFLFLFLILFFFFNFMSE